MTPTNGDSQNFGDLMSMKIYSFMAAMENGVYDGRSKDYSGKIKVDDFTIKDWND